MPLPESDPVDGAAGPLVKLWRRAADGSLTSCAPKLAALMNWRDYWNQDTPIYVSERHKVLHYG